MKRGRLTHLRNAIDARNVGDIAMLVEKMPPKHARDAEEMLTRFYNHEVAIANTVLELAAYSKVYQSKIKPPLRGSFCFQIPESGERAL